MVPMQSAWRFLQRFDGFFAPGLPRRGDGRLQFGAVRRTRQLMDPLSGPLLSGYAKRTSDGRRLAAAYAAALGMVGSLYVPAAVGMAMIAPNVVAVILGERWLDAVPIVRALAIYHVVLGLAAQGDDVLRALGRMRRLTATIYIQLAVSAPLLFLAARTGDAAVVAAAKAAAIFLIAPILLWALIQVSSVSARLIAAALIRPLLASAAMAGVLWLARGLPPTVAGLLTQLLLGGSVYAFAAALLWFAAGRPHGPGTAIDWLRSLLAKRGRSPTGSGE
jgi:O-antigen/teichoic acid export membrane protein